VSRAYVTLLIATVAAIVVARLVLAPLPLRRVAARLSVSDAVLIGVGTAGLAFHCGAMFFRATVERSPGVHSAVRSINAMGTSSKLWFIVPALLVVIGLRRQYPIALFVLAAALVAVGVTMYDDGPLRTHLNAIFIAVVVLAGVASVLVVPPWSRGVSSSPR
jgi:hypothetical protein